MKSYKRNITTASLCSASSKRSRRNIISQVTLTSKQKPSNVSNNIKKKTAIGNNKYKLIFCHGCNNEFKFYQNINLFMIQHVHKNKTCLKVYPKCVCDKVFYNIKRLKAHQSRKSKNCACYQKFCTDLTNTKFNSSEVTIQQVRKPSQIPSDTSQHDFEKSLPIQDDLMIAKKNVLHSQFQLTLKFQNMNIHNINNTKLAQFKGFASMDTKKIDVKKNIIYDGIYCQPTNMDHILPNKRDVICEQVIDYRDF